MENPWTNLPTKPPYVLAEDRDVVMAANSRLTDAERTAFGYQLQLLPDPFIGDLKAPFVMVYLNPGYTPPSPAGGTFNDDWWHANSAELRQAYRMNFAQEPMRYPFFFLDPQFRTNPGGKYWTERLSEVLNYCGREQLAQNLLALEFFPYHSENYKNLCSVPSQQFTIEQIQASMERGAEILIMRAKTTLRAAVPQLGEYDYLKPKSPQSGYVSRKNVPGFDRIINAVRRAA